MMSNRNGITNTEIEKFFNNETNNDLKRNFMGVYSSNSIAKYINFYYKIKEKRAKYQFSNFNKDRENKLGKHWWSFLDIHPKRDPKIPRQRNKHWKKFLSSPI